VLGPWSDLAAIVHAAALRALGQGEAAELALAPLRERIATQAGPHYIYRPDKSAWVSVHQLPAQERRVMEQLL
uniref:hypothetical protein n=1 Tax=Serratia marcescens TaxID=615 RepID=UPI0013DCE974